MERSGDRQMRAAAGAVLGLVSIIAVPIALAASFDCSARPLTQAEITVCNDPQLSRMEEQLTRRLNGLATRLNFGQYLGLRHWAGGWARERGECESDRDCIAANLRAQGRFLDRFQRCLTGSLARRGCLRDMLAGEQESMRR
jgi:uncharacterized protein